MDHSLGCATLSLHAVIGLGVGNEAARLYNAVVGAAVAWPILARAQQAGRVYRLGSLHVSPRTAPYHVAFYEALKDKGFVEGQNLSVDEHGYALPANQVREHALELARAQVDVIVCAGDPTMQIALEATKSIPIVGSGLDLVGSGVGQAWRQCNRREFPRQRA
jgi:putative ABC transport system substrate-binding protein